MTTEMTISYEAEVEGKTLVPGTIFKRRGERGKSYRFIKLVTPEGGEPWVDCFGGSPSRQQSRSVALDTIQPESIKKSK